MIRLPSPPRTLGEHLLCARYQRGLRQKDVAQELGVDQFTLGNWKNGRTTPVLRHRPSINVWLGYCPIGLTPTSVGERLVDWRKSQGLSQHEVARRAGLDPGTVSRAEHGKTDSPNGRVRQAIEGLLRTAGARSINRTWAPQASGTK